MTERAVRAMQSAEKKIAARDARIAALEAAVREYLAEYDNPVPDGLVRRLLRAKLRSALGN